MKSPGVKPLVLLAALFVLVTVVDSLSPVAAKRRARRNAENYIEDWEDFQEIIDKHQDGRLAMEETVKSSWKTQELEEDDLDLLSASVDAEMELDEGQPGDAASSSSSSSDDDDDEYAYAVSDDSDLSEISDIFEDDWDEKK